MATKEGKVIEGHLNPFLFLCIHDHHILIATHTQKGFDHHHHTHLGLNSEGRNKETGKKE